MKRRQRLLKVYIEFRVRFIVGALPLLIVCAILILCLLPYFEDVWSKKHQYANEAVFCRYIHQRDFWFSKYAGVCYSTLSLRGSGFGYDGKTRVSLYFYIDKTDIKSRAAYRKFFIDTLLQPRIMPSTTSSGILGCPKIYLIRYAQTLLTHAEASARSGQLTEKAYDCVNMVRRRANKLPLHEPSPFDLPRGLSPEAFADSVLQERAWELAGEIGHRWFDMVRNETVEKVFEGRDPNDGGPFIPSTNDKYFYPIPQEDINLNPNLGE
jgi:hypothetical protein